MAGSFPLKDVEALLVKCHRRCCICHRFCGVKIETDHITPKSDEGTDTIDNAIAVCFECHAEIHSYNTEHPRGRKFYPEELRKHKEQWLAICESKPESLIGAARDTEVGPLQALIDELEFNMAVVEYPLVDSQDHLGCFFFNSQFQRAIREGIIATLQEGLKETIIEAYVAISHTNQILDGALAYSGDRSVRRSLLDLSKQSIAVARPKIEKARHALLQFLKSE